MTVLFTCAEWESEDHFRKAYAARDVAESIEVQAVPSMRTMDSERDEILIDKRPS